MHEFYYILHAHAYLSIFVWIILEAGFDTITPNSTLDIYSWVWNHLISINIQTQYIHNTASGVLCYHPGYTLVEKIQTIIRKYRNSNTSGESNITIFMQQYYDVYCLLGNEGLIAFTQTAEYKAYKSARIKGADKQIPVAENSSLLLEDAKIRESFEARYKATSKLYYNGQPDFDDVLARIAIHLPNL